MHERRRGRSLLTPAPFYFSNCLIWSKTPLLHSLEEALQVDDLSTGSLGVAALTTTRKLALCLLEQDVADVRSLISDRSETRHEITVCADAKVDSGRVSVSFPVKQTFQK
jgi:hypothetical protein